MLENALLIFFLLSGFAGVVVGGAMKAVAGKDVNLNKLSHQVMVAGLVAIAFAILVDKVF